MSYFARIASRGAAVPSAHPIAQPALPSASPLAAFDQRLHPSSEGEPPLDALSGIPVVPPLAAGAAETPPSHDPNPVAATRAGTMTQPSMRFRAFGVTPVTSEGADLGEPVRPASALFEPLDVRTRAPVRSEPAAAFDEVTEPVRERPLQPAARRSATSIDDDVQTPAAPRPAVRVVSPQTSATDERDAETRLEPASTPSRPATLQVRADEAPRALQRPTARDTQTSARNPASTLAAALSKVDAWMRRPAAMPVAPAEAGPPPAPQQRSASAGPKLVIGQIDVEVIAPAPPARRPARTPRMAAAPRPAPSVLAKQSFGARQR